VVFSLERTGRGSMILSSNRDTAEWLAMFDDVLRAIDLGLFEATSPTGGREKPFRGNSPAVARSVSPGPITMQMGGSMGVQAGKHPIPRSCLRSTRFSATRLDRGRGAERTVPRMACRITSIAAKFAPDALRTTRESLRPTRYAGRGPIMRRASTNPGR
jgi:hypothetical protein